MLTNDHVRALEVQKSTCKAPAGICQQSKGSAHENNTMRELTGSKLGATTRKFMSMKTHLIRCQGFSCSRECAASVRTRSTPAAAAPLPLAWYKFDFTTWRIPHRKSSLPYRTDSKQDAKSQQRKSHGTMPASRARAPVIAG